MYSALPRYCPKPAGKLGDSSRFNIRPRTRPRWYGAEHRSSSTDGSRRDDGGRGRGSGVRDSRGPRLETRNDELIGNKRQRLREVKTERRPHRSHQTHQGRGVGAIRSADRGYYGPGRGNSDRNGHEGRAPRITPASHQRADPEHDFKGRVGHGKHCKVSPGGPLRSRSSSRSRPQVRQRYRSGSPPPSHGSDKRCRSMSSGKGQSRGQTRCEARPWNALYASIRRTLLCLISPRPSRILMTTNGRCSFSE